MPGANFPSHHQTPFSALAAIVAGCLRRAEASGATYTHIDMLDAADPPLPAVQHLQPQPQEQEQGQAEERQQPPSQQVQDQAQHQHQQALLPSPRPPQPPPQQQQQQQQHEHHPILLIADDAAGLSPQSLRRALRIPQSSNSCSSTVAAPAATVSGATTAGPSSNASSSGLNGSKWPDFVHAALRLGSTVLVLTKRRGQGASAGLLSCTAAPGASLQVATAAVDWNADGSRQLVGCRQRSTAGPQQQPSAAESTGSLEQQRSDGPGSNEWQAALDIIEQGWAVAGCSGSGSEEWLREQLVGMPEQGTRVMVAGLRTTDGPATSTAAAKTATPEHEIDWRSDSSDIQSAVPAAAEAAAGAGDGSNGQGAGAGEASTILTSGQLRQKKKPQQGCLDAGVQRCMAVHQSLRVYLALLFVRWPQGFQLRLRGKDVQLQTLRDWMLWPTTEEYRPRGIRVEVDDNGFQMQHVVNVHIGFLKDAPNTSLQGICVYQNNRLVKPFWRVYSSSTVGAGVIGYLEVDFLEPKPDWQDFEPTHVLARLEAFLKRAVPAYWKRHAHLRPSLAAQGMQKPAQSALQDPWQLQLGATAAAISGMSGRGPSAVPHQQSPRVLHQHHMQGSSSAAAAAAATAAAQAQAVNRASSQAQAMWQGIAGPHSFAAVQGLLPPHLGSLLQHQRMLQQPMPVAHQQPQIETQLLQLLGLLPSPQQPAAAPDALAAAMHMMQAQWQLAQRQQQQQQQQQHLLAALCSLLAPGLPQPAASIPMQLAPLAAGASLAMPMPAGASVDATAPSQLLQLLDNNPAASALLKLLISKPTEPTPGNGGSSPLQQQAEQRPSSAGAAAQPPSKVVPLARAPPAPLVHTRQPQLQQPASSQQANNAATAVARDVTETALDGSARRRRLPSDEAATEPAAQGSQAKKTRLT